MSTSVLLRPADALLRANRLPSRSQLGVDADLVLLSREHLGLLSISRLPSRTSLGASA